MIFAALAGLLAAQASSVAVDQVQQRTPANITAPQLPKTPRKLGVSDAQRSPRDASAPSSSSTRGDSRPHSAARLSGPDRCDPARPGKAPPVCQRVIESRADEFTRPAPRSPESDLLRRRTVRPAEDAAAAARQLGRGEITEGGAEAAVSQSPAPEPDRADPATDAAQAVLGRPGAPVIQLPPGR